MTIVPLHPAPHRHQDHFVHFYKDEDFVADAVAEFLEPGFRNGQALVLICTVQHRDEIYDFLMTRHCGVAAAVKSGQLRWLDARLALAKFMVGRMPDPELFTNCMGHLLKDACVGREHRTVRAFGEMVDILMRDGNPQGAIRLEELWNSLGPEYGFSLLCAYAIGNLFREEYWKYFKAVCDQHAKLSDQTVETIRQSRTVA